MSEMILAVMHSHIFLAHPQKVHIDALKFFFRNLKLESVNPISYVRHLRYF
jgi:hypothetical protein